MCVIEEAETMFKTSVASEHGCVLSIECAFGKDQRILLWLFDSQAILPADAIMFQRTGPFFFFDNDEDQRVERKT